MKKIQMNLFAVQQKLTYNIVNQLNFNKINFKKEINGIVCSEIIER